MTTLEARATFEKTNKNLRRSRRLYSYLIFESCIGDRDKVVLAARRAQSAGLYSKKTALSDVVYSIIRYMKILDIAANPSFYHWSRNNKSWIEFNFDTECEGYSRFWIK